MAFLRRKRADSPILRTREVDSVALSPDGNTVALSMVETRPWSDTDKQLREVQEKLYAYLDYIVGGQLAEEHPDLAVKRKLIVLHCLEQPTGETHAFLERFAAVLQDHDVAFEVWMLADEQ